MRKGWEGRRERKGDGGGKGREGARGGQGGKEREVGGGGKGKGERGRGEAEGGFGKGKMKDGREQDAADSPDSEHSVWGLFRVLVHINLSVGGLPDGRQMTATLPHHLGEHGSRDGHLLGPEYMEGEIF